MTINKGDEIKIEGTPENSAYARVDKLDFVVESVGIADNIFQQGIRKNNIIFSNPLHTSIKLTGKAYGSISLQLYDSKGRFVKAIETNLWDGIDDKGTVLQPGVYFLRGAVDNRLIAAQKVLVIK